MLVFADKTRDLEIRKGVSTCSGWGFELAIVCHEHVASVALDGDEEISTNKIILESGEHWKIISKNLFTFGFRPRNIRTSKLMMEELLRCSGPGCSAIFNRNTSLDAEIGQPEDTLTKARVVTGSLERGPKSLKAASHLVRLLPNEILADVFEFGVAAESLVEPDYPPRSHDTRKAHRTHAQVCHRWRGITSTLSLWKVAGYDPRFTETVGTSTPKSLLGLRLRLALKSAFICCIECDLIHRTDTSMRSLDIPTVARSHQLLS
ncbi:hypothetical protein L218DRAFT_88916 [Marasmius fiardii PR-910]|nr:hypothetical protein L218DRAFT_88916 [Marasmius fiardii PR-910]